MELYSIIHNIVLKYGTSKFKIVFIRKLLSSKAIWLEQTQKFLKLQHTMNKQP
jgi:hypothetical protein